jgi:16S rRNA A1518/A1519 N6-dimethyltransferase RsmA/KsgA/DIM1 with predicted DNA glycosylase/AP lyase activity
MSTRGHTRLLGRAAYMAYQSDLIFDIGLHRGEDTDFYLKKGFRVAAFEVDPNLVAHCRPDSEMRFQRGDCK